MNTNNDKVNKVIQLLGEADTDILKVIKLLEDYVDSSTGK